MASTTLFTACKKDEVKTYAKVNLIHTSPNAPSFNIAANSVNLTTSPLLYGYNTGYIDVVSGAEKFAFTNTVGVSSTMSVSADLQANANYSLFAIDSYNKLNALFLSDDLSSPSNGKAKIRFVQLSPDTKVIDIKNTINGVNMFGAMNFKDASGFISVDPGVYDLAVRCDRTIDTVTYNVPTVVLSSGKIYTVYTKGFMSATGKQALNSAVILNKN